MMKVNEIFYSLQGEGFLAGVPSVFVRLAGCPLRCRWCDTKYAQDYEAGRDYEAADIVEAVQKSDSRFIVITGGEPLVTAELQPREGLKQLTKLLKVHGWHITIETVGGWFLEDLACDLMSISPKLSNAVPKNSIEAVIHKKNQPDLAVLAELVDKYDYLLKFVVDTEADLAEILSVIKRIDNVDKNKIMLMPQAATKSEYLEKSPMVADLCAQTGFTFCQRLQLLLWDGARGR